MKIAILPGDGIGPEIMAQAVKVLGALGEPFEMEQAPVGGAGYEAHGHPLPARVVALRAAGRESRPGRGALVRRRKTRLDKGVKHGPHKNKTK